MDGWKGGYAEKIGGYAAADVIRGWADLGGATGRVLHAIEFDFFGSRRC